MVISFLTHPHPKEEYNMFLNYYSKPRIRTTGTMEQLQKELQYNQGRIITKTVTTPGVNQTTRNKVRNTLYKLQNKLRETNIQLVNTNISAMPSMYHLVKIPKKTGGYRELMVPDEELKEFQRIILDTLQNKLKVLPHNAAHGFTKHRSCYTAIQVHQQAHARWFLKMDIKNFFTSVHTEWLLSTLQENAAICIMNASTARNFEDSIIRYCTLNNCLPQGAPTSPFLANLAMQGCDTEITAYCKRLGLTYTRYADDILISSPVKFKANEVAEAISTILLRKNLSVNRDKTRFGSCNGRNWNLGLMYNKDEDITVGYRAKKLMKNKLHNIESRGYTNKELHQFRGLLSYYNGIEPAYFAPYLERAKALPLHPEPETE